MDKFTTLTGVGAPLAMINVDTDTIIPKLYCKNTGRSGYGAHLFHDLRYFEDGFERPEFVLNRAPYRNAAILIAGANFGCGSSREAAVWALGEFGIRCIIAPGFSDIFANNCFQNALLPIVLAEPVVDELMRQVKNTANPELSVDLSSESLVAPDGKRIGFRIDPYRRHCLLNGLDEIAATMIHEAAISAYERKLGQTRPWHKPAGRN